MAKIIRALICIGALTVSSPDFDAAAPRETAAALTTASRAVVALCRERTDSCVAVAAATLQQKRQPGLDTLSASDRAIGWRGDARR